MLSSVSSVSSLPVSQPEVASALDPTQPDDKKKKKTKHYFEHHIRKILKEVCSERDITQQAKSQLNELAIITCRLIVQKINYILTSSKKKTVTETEVESAVKLTFNGQLSQKSAEEGNKCLKNYISKSKNDDLKGQSRHSKADILIPPSILDNFLREQGHHISYHAPIFLAGVIEYFLSQVLVVAITVSNNKKSVRLTIHDIEKGIRSDKELSFFFTKYNIYLFGSGTVPFVHPMLRGKKGRNDKKSMKSIVKLQENTDPIFPKSFFENKLKQYISLVYPDIRFQKGCFLYFQDYIEKWLVDLLQHTNILTLYSKKTRVSEDDIELVLSIVEKRLPTFLTKEPVIEESQVLHFSQSS